MGIYNNDWKCQSCEQYIDDIGEVNGPENCCRKAGIAVDDVAICPLNKFDNTQEEKDFIVPVTWEACGFIKVKASSALVACQMVHDNPDDYPLPYQSEYVDASFNISGDIEEAAAMSEIFTKDYESGKWGQYMIFKEEDKNE